jgi:hypothetical protein
LLNPIKREAIKNEYSISGTTYIECIYLFDMLHDKKRPACSKSFLAVKLNTPTNIGAVCSYFVFLSNARISLTGSYEIV